MRSLVHIHMVLFVVILFAACGPRQPPRAPGGPGTLMDFLQAYNSYSLAQLYLERGRHAEAVVEYEESLKRYERLDEAARTTLREQYGLSLEQIERELSVARTLAQK